MRTLFLICLELAVLAGCTSKSSADNQASEAYEQGLKEGHSKGYEEGQAEGYKKGYNEGYDEGYDDTQRPVIEERHGYRESTHPVTCPTCGGDGWIDGISNKEICPTCNMSGAVQVTEKEYY